MKQPAPQKSRPVRVKRLSERDHQMFWACSGLAIALVAVGWFFSMRDAIVRMSVNVPAITGLAELREQFESVTGTLAENTEAPRAEIEQILNPVAEEFEASIQEGVAQREAAANAVGDAFIENLAKPASESGTDQADSVPPEAVSPSEP